MRDSSAVIIQLLDILALRMLYSNNWDVNDSSGFFLDLCWLYVRMFAPSHREVFCGKLMKLMACLLRRDRDSLIVTR